MIKYIVRRPPFYPGIFSGVSPSVGPAGHLSKLHLSGFHQGGPPARPAGGHFVSSVHRCPRGHAVMSELGAGSQPGWARRVPSFWSGIPSSGFLTCPNDNCSLNLDYLLLNNIGIWKTLIVTCSQIKWISHIITCYWNYLFISTILVPYTRVIAVRLKAYTRCWT